MIDGVPANAVGDGEYNFADIPLDDIERIELLRGPQSGLYGANAQSGVLTIETKSGRGLTKPEFNGRFELGTQRSTEGAATFRGAVGPVYGSTTVSYATTNGFNIARDGNELDGAKRAAVTAKVGVDLTPYFNVEGFVRHLQRNAAYDPQDPFFVNNGLVVDAPGYSTRIGETLARVQGTLKLFDDRWIQSMKWTGSRNGTFNFENFRQTSNSLGTAQTLTYKSTRAARQQLRGRREAPHHRPPGKPARALLVRQQHPAFFTPADVEAARNGYARSANSVGGEYVLDLLRTGTTISIAQRQDFNEPFEDEYTWRYLDLAAARANRRAPALERRARRHQPELLRAVRVHHQHVPAQSQPRAGELDRLGRRLGADSSGTAASFVDVTYFNSRLEHEIVLRSLPNFKTTAENLDGPSTRQGVEVTAKFRPFDWLMLAGTYTYTDARDDKGLEEIRRPPHAASGSATVLFDQGRGKATLNVIYNGQMKDTIFTFPSSTTTLNAYTLVGGMISYDTTPWSTVYVRAENVFDQRYEEVYSYRSPGAAVYAGVKVRTN